MWGKIMRQKILLLAFITFLLPAQLGAMKKSMRSHSDSELNNSPVQNLPTKTPPLAIIPESPEQLRSRLNRSAQNFSDDFVSNQYAQELLEELKNIVGTHKYIVEQFINPEAGPVQDDEPEDLFGFEDAAGKKPVALAPDYESTDPLAQPFYVSIKKLETVLSAFNFTIPNPNNTVNPSVLIREAQHVLTLLSAVKEDTAAVASATGYKKEKLAATLNQTQETLRQLIDKYLNNQTLVSLGILKRLADCATDEQKELLSKQFDALIYVVQPSELTYQDQKIFCSLIGQEKYQAVISQFR